MSDDTICISELEAKRKEWPERISPVLNAQGEWHGAFDHSDNEHSREGYIECHSYDTDSAELFAALIAAEHNATPALIAIAKAALEWKRTSGAPRGDRTADVAERALLDVLAKVTP